MRGFSGTGVRDICGVSGKFNHCQLHAQADPKIGNSSVSGVFRCENHSFDPAVPESARNKDTLKIIQYFLTIGGIDLFRIDPFNIYMGVQTETGMGECLRYGQICVMELYIFSDDSIRRFRC